MRQLAFGSIVLVLVTFGWDMHGFGQQVPIPRGELRIVDKNPNNWSSTTFNVIAR